MVVMLVCKQVDKWTRLGTATEKLEKELGFTKINLILLITPSKTCNLSSCPVPNSGQFHQRVCGCE